MNTTPDKPAPDVTRVLKRYMEECASFCPFCETSDNNVRRLIGVTDIQSFPEAMPTATVACYCACCAREWYETYRLESVVLKQRTRHGVPRND